MKITATETDVPQEHKLEYTGHPLVNTGLAALTVFGDHSSPEQITAKTIEDFVRWAQKNYYTPEAVGQISVGFSNLLQFTMSPQGQHARIREYLTLPNTQNTPCAFCSNPKSAIRADRMLIPNLSGAGQVNFFPHGKAGLPVCSSCVVALQALIISGARVGGGLLVLQTEPHTMQSIVTVWQKEIRERIDFVRMEGQKAQSWTDPASAIMNALMDFRFNRKVKTVPITAYHLSNSGQGPFIVEFVLGARVLEFMRKAKQPSYKNAWNTVIGLGYIKAKKDKDNKVISKYTPNRVYTALLSLNSLGDARLFVRRFINIRGGKNIPNSWKLAELFTKEIIEMSVSRIELIRQVADRLSEIIIDDLLEGRNNSDTYNKLFGKAKYASHARRALIALNSNLVKLKNLNGEKTSKVPLFSMDAYITLMEPDPLELKPADFTYVWDLMSVRVHEQLYKAVQEGKLKPESMTELDPTEATDTKEGDE